MILLALALALQAQAVPLPPVSTRPADPAAAAAYPARRQKLAADGQALLARGQATQINYKPGRGRPNKAELDAATGELKSALDAMSEMGEAQSQRLQVAMERVSKAQATLSNLLKKADDTGKGIVGNIK